MATKQKIVEREAVPTNDGQWSIWEYDEDREVDPRDVNRGWSEVTPTFDTVEEAWRWLENFEAGRDGGPRGTDPAPRLIAT